MDKLQFQWYKCQESLINILISINYLQIKVIFINILTNPSILLQISSNSFNKCKMNVFKQCGSNYSSKEMEDQPFSRILSIKELNCFLNNICFLKITYLPQCRIMVIPKLIWCHRKRIISTLISSHVLLSLMQEALLVKQLCLRSWETMVS